MASQQRQPRNLVGLSRAPWTALQLLLVLLLSTLSCDAGPEDEKLVNWTYPRVGYDGRGSFVANVAAPAFQCELAVDWLRNLDLRLLILFVK
jgi:hypothetical protein